MFNHQGVADRVWKALASTNARRQSPAVCVRNLATMCGTYGPTKDDGNDTNPRWNAAGRSWVAATTPLRHSSPYNARENAKVEVCCVGGDVREGPIASS